MFLCLPCAVRLQGHSGIEVRVGNSQREKGTCEECKLRKYGYHCKVRIRSDEERMKEREMYICLRCRGELEGRLNFEEIDECRPQRRSCQICGKKAYTSLYAVTDKLKK